MLRAVRRVRLRRPVRALTAPRYVQRGRCPECSRVFVLRKGGALREHKRYAYGTYRLVPCEGSGREPGEPI